MDEVWIVDDDESIRWVLEKALQREGFLVKAFTAATHCLAALEDATPAVLVSDIRMPGTNGIELLSKIKTRNPGLPVIIMTAYSDLESAVSAFQSGAFEYLPKPFDLPAAVELIRRAVEEGKREAYVEVIDEQPMEMLGQAPAMQEVFRAIGRLSQSSATVLITGESGSGKELVARALHKHSPRASQAFVALNTAAIPKDLLESELFGHERGAFTGAQQMRRGRFEQAEGGTLFLDEIGDMPSELQTRLLRVLADGQFYRVGGHQPLKANVRVIAATHQNLEDRVTQGLFREDLFHRLNVIRLRLPSLRERAQDVPLLAKFFLQKSARDLGVDAKQLSEPAVRALAGFHWPGNVRQLENMANWLTVMAPSQVVSIKDLPIEVQQHLANEAIRPVGAFASNLIQPAQPTQPTQFIQGNYAEPSVASSVASPAMAEFPLNTNHVDRSAATNIYSQLSPADFVQSNVNAAIANPSVGNVSQFSGWEEILAKEVSHLLSLQPMSDRDSGESDLMNGLARRFESTVIKQALKQTRGRRIDAALRLGIGRNTITRKIQELKLEDV
jgi:two-component system, NtrC family, nitrogen regulation response regulator GlnG